MKVMLMLKWMHCKCDWTDTGAKQGFSQHTAEVSTDATDMPEHDMSCDDAMVRHDILSCNGIVES